ncbi:MAG: FkbM family methyltransferase [Alphaproteobacteria bacterium]|nr:FkbM family methyltransferase [Alphaproteobacteria bacterium]
MHLVLGAVAARPDAAQPPDAPRLVDSIKQVLRPLKARWSRSPPPSWHTTADVMRRHGLQPRTIFDIGVAYGTYELYREFPDAFYYLVDPTSNSLRYMRQLARQLDCEVLNVALADHDGQLEIEVRADIQGSTFFEEVGPRDVLRRETVVVRRFDTLIGMFDRPALAKIDVQGSELAVLQGMGDRIREFDAIIAETSTLATIKGGPELYDLIAFMKAHGFVAFDVLGYARRPLDHALAQIDMLFVPEESPLRADRRWATTA